MSAVALPSFSNGLDNLRLSQASDSVAAYNRGMPISPVPELVAELAAGHFDAFASCNRTCEIGMTRATGPSQRLRVQLLAQG